MHCVAANKSVINRLCVFTIVFLFCPTYFKEFKVVPMCYKLLHYKSESLSPDEYIPA